MPWNLLKRDGYYRREMKTRLSILTSKINTELRRKFGVMSGTFQFMTQIWTLGEWRSRPMDKVNSQRK